MDENLPNDGGYWPTPLEVAKGMNAAKKYVVSKTIQRRWNNTQLLEGDPVNALRDLKTTGGPNIAVLGSGSIAAQLTRKNIADGMTSGASQ